MDAPQFKIKVIAQELNARAHAHAIGALQTIRATLKGFARRPGRAIFSSQTIHGSWAAHHGGRTELQFNIGTEEVSGKIQFRHGVAFSFELSQRLPSIDVLIPKVRLFNDYMQLYPETYADMRMWHYREDERSSDYPPGPVMPELVRAGTFVFLGKRQGPGQVDYDTVLNDFDRFLPLYMYVESGGKEAAVTGAAESGVRFRPGFTDKAPTTIATLAEQELNVNLKHNILQAALCRRLISEFGSENVGDEQPTGLGTKIDVVLRRSEDKFWYYEIKTAASPRACLREAFGQLLEYAYWPGAREAKRLIICGESAMDDDGIKYLRQLRKRFGLPIEYQRIVL